MHKILITTICALGVGMTASAYAGNGQHGPKYHEHGRSPMGFVRQLDLSAEQRKAMRETLVQHRTGFETMRDAMREQAQALAELDSQAPEYAARVEAFADRASNLARQRVDGMAQLRGELWAILTPEQRSKQLAMVAELADRTPGRIEKRLREHGEERFERMAQDLELSDEQRTQVEGLLTQFRDKSAPTRAAMRGEFMELLAMNPEAADFSSRVQAAADVAARSAYTRARDLAGLQGELASVLTPQQREALMARLSQGGRRHHDGESRGDRRQSPEALG